MVTKTEFIKVLDNQKFTNKDQSLVKQAIKLAENAHLGQKRDNGADYLEDHIFPLAVSIIDRYKNSNDFIVLLCSVILHDVLEDSDISENEMLEGVGYEITNTVKALTKNREENASGLPESIKMEKNRIYLKRVEKVNNAIILKLEDRLHNLSCITNETYQIKPEKYKRYIVETEKLFIPLAKRVNAHINYVKLLISEVERVRNLFT